MAVKFKTDKENLLSLILPAVAASSTKSTLPALEGILISLDGNTLTTCGYDLEKGVKCTGKVFSSEDGEIIINAQKIAAIIRNMPDCEISFEADSKNTVNIRGEQSEFSIQGLSADAFPNLPTLGGEKSFFINKDMLKKTILKTYFAVAQTDARPILTGELFNIKGNKLTVVALDNFRLALREENTAVSAIDEDISFVVPGKSLYEFSKLLDGEDDTVKVEITKKHIIFSIDNKILFSRLLEGEFLDYERALPKSNKIFVKINRNMFIDSVERASLIVDEKLKTPIKCVFTDNELTIFCSTTKGTVSDSISIEKNGPDIEIGFNHRYLLDALKACDDDIILVGMSTPNMSMVISPSAADDESNYAYLVLPCHLKN